MPTTVIINNAIVTLCNTDLVCPACQYVHNEDFWYPTLYKSKSIVIYKKCKGCKKHLGITTDIRGDVVTWLKSEENDGNER